jgi:hypothetical protein
MFQNCTSQGRSGLEAKQPRIRFTEATLMPFIRFARPSISTTIAGGLNVAAPMAGQKWPAPVAAPTAGKQWPAPVAAPTAGKQWPAPVE